MISNEAVEAATAAIDTCGCEPPEWIARKALEAAAPHMQNNPYADDAERYNQRGDYDEVTK